MKPKIVKEKMLSKYFKTMRRSTEQIENKTHERVSRGVCPNIPLNII